MDNYEIIDKLSKLTADKSKFVVFPSREGHSYYGKNAESDIVFMILSGANRLPPVSLETKSLSFVFNYSGSFIVNGDVKNKIVHILTCKERKTEIIEAFVRLTKAFATNEENDDQVYLPKLFSILSSLFDKERAVNDIELIGLYAELYSIKLFREFGFDIASKWQSRDRMKFDFSFNEEKRLEIKSTIKPTRIHHFRHEQLLSEIYDIVVVSIMVQPNDAGLSLFDLIEEIRSENTSRFAIQARIDSIVAHVTTESLHAIKYDERYSKNNIKFYRASQIPHFNEKTPEGVFHAEYDCDLENVSSLSIDEVIIWMEENTDV